MSQRNLSRRLVAECGETPRDLLRRVRMTVGKDLLSSGGHDTVAEVAAAVGLSRSYFQRLYAAWFGNPPAQDLG